MMKKLLLCGAAMLMAAAIAVPGWSQDQEQSKWQQLPDMNDFYSFTATKDSFFELTVADDWMCESGNPIVHVRWWGTYHAYEGGNPGPVEQPPVVDRPSKFVLSWHEDDNGKPGTEVASVEIQRDDQNFTEAYYGTAEDWMGGAWYDHVFQYDYYLETPWEQKAGETYWLDIQAVFETDGMYHWDWVTTKPVDGLFNIAMEYDETEAVPAWEKLEFPNTPGFEHPHAGKDVNMAFELIVMTPQAQIGLNAAVFNAGETITATFVANEAINQAFTAFAVIILPSGSMLNAIGLNTPLAPVATNVQSLPAGFSYPLLNTSISQGAPLGNYVIVAAFFDPTVPITGRSDAFLEASAPFEIQ